MRRRLVLVPALACAVGTGALARDARSELDGRVAGPPASCIELDRVTGPIIENASTVLYRQSGARIWRMVPQNACPALRQGAHLLITNGIDRRLCVGDRFDVLPPGSSIASGHCRFGSFTPFNKAPR